MNSIYSFFYSEEEEEIDACKEQRRLKFLLTQQIKLSKIKLKINHSIKSDWNYPLITKLKI